MEEDILDVLLDDYLGGKGLSAVEISRRTRIESIYIVRHFLNDLADQGKVERVKHGGGGVRWRMTEAEYEHRRTD